MTLPHMVTLPDRNPHQVPGAVAIPEPVWIERVVMITTDQTDIRRKPIAYSLHLGYSMVAVVRCKLPLHLDGPVTGNRVIAELADSQDYVMPARTALFAIGGWMLFSMES